MSKVHKVTREIKMSSGWYWRSGLFLFGTLLSIYLLVPSFYNFNAIREAHATSGVPLPWYIGVFPEKQVKLGLDLQGGIHLVLGVDLDKAMHDHLSILLTDLREDLTKQNYPLERIQSAPDQLKLIVQFKSDDPVKKIDANSFSEIRAYVRKRYPIFHLVPFASGYGFDLTLKEDELKYIRHNTLDQALQVLRNRIDEFGISEPSIGAQGEDRILVQLPGVKDPTRAKQLIGKTAQLSFMLVEENQPVLEDILKAFPKLPETISVDYERMQNKAGETVERPFLRGENREDLTKFLEGKVPETHAIYLEESVNKQTLNKNYRTWVLRHDTFLTGDMLEDARTDIDPQWNRPVVSLRFNPKGAELFRQVTTDHVHERLAIVLDQNVMSAPVINDPIPNGRAVISFNQSLDHTALTKEAGDLAIILRAGSLKAPVEILEDRTIGPTLGADSIRTGKLSFIVGLAAVVIFMFVYYRMAGLWADLALVLNGLFILATLVVFQATLTLPGIAGLILTAGMAVDANVIIYERIREELRAGKNARNAIQAGFDRAFWTVFDSNVTTALAGVILMQYGTGPIKGFAVTLLIGLVFSFITAVYFTKLIFDWIVDQRNPQSLSI